jgi:signal transduction histidine kinase
MTKQEEEAQAELRRIVEALKKVQSQLRDIVAALPSTLEEAMYAEEDPDVATEIRSIIECVLTDQIGPAVRDLSAAAEYRRKKRDEP